MENFGGFDSFIYNLALSLPGILVAVVVHEVAHGRMALHFGDRTAQMAGRLSLNPIVHIDLFGSILMPVLGALFGGIIFGWAKPVPVDFRNFSGSGKRIRYAIFWVSFAGPLSNFILMILSAFLCALIALKVSPAFYLYEPLIKILTQSVFINTIIGVFNLIPIPPLDGSKMVMPFLSYPTQIKYEMVSRYGIFILLFLMFVGAFRYIFFPFVLAAQKVLELFYSIL